MTQTTPCRRRRPPASFGNEKKNPQTWRLADLAREVDLPPALVQKRMMLWVNQGVVSESSPGPVYRLVKDQVNVGSPFLLLRGMAAPDINRLESLKRRSVGC